MTLTIITTTGISILKMEVTSLYLIMVFLYNLNNVIKNRTDKLT